MDIVLKPTRKKREGKKQRKYGRAGRRPAHNRYNMEQRWLKNKARRIAKQARKEAKQKEKKARRVLALAQR